MYTQQTIFGKIVGGNVFWLDRPFVHSTIIRNFGTVLKTIQILHDAQWDFLVCIELHIFFNVFFLTWVIYT